MSAIESGRPQDAEAERLTRREGRCRFLSRGTVQTAGAVPTAQRAGDADPKAVRAWAQANGIEVSARGWINAGVLEQYRTANS